MGVVRDARLESPTARARLKRGRQPHWQALIEGRAHLGYQCWKGQPAGRWLLRRYIGNERYRVEALGRADDNAAANNDDVLDFVQAKTKALTKVAAPNGNGKVECKTVRQALKLYIDYLRDQGKSVSDVESRSAAHIVPELGDLVIAELTTDTLRKWLATMASAPAQKRPKNKTPQYRDAPDGDDAVRARQASANRVLTMLKAALNFAYDSGHVVNRDAWGRKLKPFRGVDAARIHYLEIAAAQRLINASDVEFRPLICGALETGMRYSELARLEVHDFNIDAGTIAMRKSKSGKPRHVVLTPEGAEFFRQHCAGLSGNELMFRHTDGSRWDKSEQARPMRDACAHGKIKPRVSFHALRHTWASHAVMNGTPLLVVAKNLGHRDTRMVERHYGHLAPDFVKEAIHAGAPRFGTTTPSTVVPMGSKRAK